MANYLSPIVPYDDEPTRLSKMLLSVFSVNDNINYPIEGALQTAAAASNSDIHDWSDAKKRGIWNRTANAWKTRAMAAGVEWGTKNAPDRRGSEVSAKIKTISATSVSCRPIQYINATPVSLAIYPAQVLIVSIASASISASTNQTQRHMEILENRLCWSERLVRMSVSTSFQTNASVHSTNAPIQIRQFLLPPIFLLSESRFTVPKTQYNSFWPNQAIRPVNDALSLQQLLDTGNDQTNTLVVLAHQGCNILGWMGWAKQMSCMSEMSSFGIAYSADHDVKFCRDNTVFGRHGLDYIISLSNRSLQAFAHYLSRLDHHVFPTYAQIDANTSLSEHDISSIIAINCRSQQQPNKGAEFVRGGLRYPGEAVAIAHAYDEGL